MTKDTTTPARSGPLAGLRILELGTMIAGPVVGTLLADFGAEVIKIEQPGTGDTLRQIGPFEQGESLYWNVEGRNKKSVTLDLRLPEGQALLRDLARQADAVVENFRPGTLAKWGLDYAELARANPRIVMLSISGFGQTGPNASRAAYDRIALAFGGLMHLTGYPDRPPLKSGNSLADYQSALFGAFALMMALYQRDACGGPGQHIDLALLDVQVAALANQTANHLIGGTVPRRMGNAHPNIVPYQDFPTADGDMILAIGNDGQFARFCAVAGRPEWAADERYASNAARVANRAALIPLLRQATVMRSTAEWIAALESEAVPCGPINRIDQVFADPQVIARGLRVDLPHPLAGSVPGVANPIRLSATPVTYRSAPPRLGQDTAEVLADWLGEVAADGSA